MITCKFIGELGNNLFQIATLISLSKKYNYDYCIPDFRSYWNEKINNKLELDNLFDYKFNYQNLNLKEYIHFDRLNYNDEKFTHCYKEINFIEDNTCIIGFFQCEKYFESIVLDLKNKYFKLKTTIVNDIKIKYGDLSKTAILHVRRGGDRISNCIYGRSFRHFPIEYYDKSIQFLKSNYDINNFLVISDDLDWCKENIKNKNINFIENTTNIEDFILFSLCKYNVLGNSTFSWWASFLNQNTNPIILSFPPHRYFVENSPLWKVDVSDMYNKNNIIIPF